MNTIVSASRVPVVVFDHMNGFDDEFALLVFLRRLEGVLVFPSERRLAAHAVDVGNFVQTGEQDSLLGRTTTHVHNRIEQVRLAL